MSIRFYSSQCLNRQVIAWKQLRSSQERAQPLAKLKCHLLNRQGGRIYRNGAIAWLTSKRALTILKGRSGIFAGGGGSFPKQIIWKELKSRYSEKLGIFLPLRALGTLHIDPTLSLLIIQLPPSTRGCERQHKDAVGGGALSSHVMWLSQLSDCGSCDTLNKIKK